MKFKITQDGIEKVVEKKEPILPEVTPDKEQVVKKPRAKKPGPPKVKPDQLTIKVTKDNIIESLNSLTEKIKSYDDEHIYEAAASNYELGIFIDKIQKIRLWFDLRDYIDEVYGDKCVYLEWSYQFEHDRIRIVEIEAYDTDNFQMRVYPKAALIEIRWLQEINMDMLYAYRIHNWSRDNIGMVK